MDRRATDGGFSAYELRIDECPVCHPASVSPDLGWPPAVVFLKLSKLLNQEDALSVPYLHSDFRSPQAKKRISQFWCHITVCDRRDVMPVCADDFREWWRMHVRCKAGQCRSGRYGTDV